MLDDPLLEAVAAVDREGSFWDAQRNAGSLAGGAGGAAR
jgi:hypothetical protein